MYQFHFYTFCGIFFLPEKPGNPSLFRFRKNPRKIFKNFSKKCLLFAGTSSIIIFASRK